MDKNDSSDDDSQSYNNFGKELMYQDDIESELNQNDYDVYGDNESNAD